MNGKLEITSGERKASQTCIELDYNIWAKDKNGVMTFLHHVGDDCTRADKIARSISNDPFSFEDIFPKIAQAVKDGNTLVVRRTTRITSWYEDDVSSFAPSSVPLN